MTMKQDIEFPECWEEVQPAEFAYLLKLRMLLILTPKALSLTDVKRLWCRYVLRHRDLKSKRKDYYLLVNRLVKTDGTLWTWGNNSSGQLGDGTVTHKSSPAQTVASSTSWSQVSCGYFHTGAIKTDGTLWLWGKNTSGQLGDNTVSSRSSPVQTVAGGTTWSQLSCGYDFTAAIKTDGTLWLWGNNAYGQLGDNTNAVNKSSPIQTITGGTTWKSVSADWWNTGAVKTDGTLWMWGHNAYGQLGDNTVAAKSSPIQTVAGGTNWRTVACGYRHTLAITN
jgi:alpha-tubulin suppressor-like RCC1 family protein